MASEHSSACRALADRLFEIIRQEDVSLSLDALGYGDDSRTARISSCAW
jgi:hypothetical protein